MMNASNDNNPSTRPPLLGVGLVALLLGSAGCIFEGKVGNEPGDGDQDLWGSGPAESSGTSSAGYTSGAPSDDATTNATATGGGYCGQVAPIDALWVCGVEVTEPVPGGEVWNEGVECEGGSGVDVVSGTWPHLFDHADCLCATMGCGMPLGGTTGNFTGGDSGDTVGDTVGGTVGDDTGGVDMCGPYPPGTESFVCTCETCSSVVTNVDSEWLVTEADIEAICECMCGWAGCGAPV